MPISELIQLGILIVLTITLLGIWVQAGRLKESVNTSNVLTRHEMYFRTYENAQRIGDPNFLKVVEAYPEDWANPDKWVNYSNNDKIKSLWFLSIYEYLFHELKLKEMKVIDEKEWKDSVEWIIDLLREDIFWDICEHHGRNYPELAGEIEKICDEKGITRILKEAKDHLA